MARDMRDILHELVRGSNISEIEKNDLHEDVEAVNPSTGKTTVKEDDDAKADDSAAESKPS